MWEAVSLFIGSLSYVEWSSEGVVLQVDGDDICGTFKKTSFSLSD